MTDRRTTVFFPDPGAWGPTNNASFPPRRGSRSTQGNLRTISTPNENFRVYRGVARGCILEQEGKMRMLGGYGTATGKPARHGYVVDRSSHVRQGEANTAPDFLR